MSVNEVTVRPLRHDDLWRVGLESDGEIDGYAAERNGALIAWGGALWKDDAPAFLTFSVRSTGVRGLMVGLHAKRLMKRLREDRGMSEMFAYCDTRVPGVEKWLRWLELSPVEEEMPGLWRWEWKSQR